MWRLIAVAFIAIFTIPAHAGEIELGGQWYKFEEILIPGGPVHRQEVSPNVTKYLPIQDDLLKRPARIMVIFGSMWTNDLMPNSHLKQRFWSIQDAHLEIRQYDGGTSFGLHFIHTLHSSIEREEANYEFEVNTFGLRPEGVMKIFKMMIDVTQSANFESVSCIEFRGKMTWSSGGRPQAKGAKRLFTYQLQIESARALKKIPVNFSAEKISLEDATALCTSTD